MTQIYNMTVPELRAQARIYSTAGVYARVTQCYERLMHLGVLHRIGYLRLAATYRNQGRTDDYRRVVRRYMSIYMA